MGLLSPSQLKSHLCFPSSFHYKHKTQWCITFPPPFPLPFNLFILCSCPPRCCSLIVFSLHGSIRQQGSRKLIHPSKKKKKRLRKEAMISVHKPPNTSSPQHCLHTLHFALPRSKDGARLALRLLQVLCESLA